MVSLPRLILEMLFVSINFLKAIIWREWTAHRIAFDRKTRYI